MSDGLAESLENWKKLTSFSAAQDWVFASPSSFGRRPYAGTASGGRWRPSCSTRERP